MQTPLQPDDSFADVAAANKFQDTMQTPLQPDDSSTNARCDNADTKVRTPKLEPKCNGRVIVMNSNTFVTEQSKWVSQNIIAIPLTTMVIASAIAICVKDVRH